jgi:NAD(P)-dependent dehydrogenase (short-subunit alcohol dehydrogenase family)
MPGLLTDKVVMVTGAASGIGRASAVVFAREGASVIVTDRDTEGGQETVARINALGGEATFQPLDVTEPDKAAATVESIVAAHGRLDGAFNNAGAPGQTTPFLDLTEQAFSCLIDVNLRGVFHCMQAQIRHMLGRGQGTIVNTSSMAGLRGLPMMHPYTATKHAVVGLTRSVALEYARTGLRINCICPGAVETPMLRGLTDSNPAVLQAFNDYTPAKRFADPSEIGEMAAWLLSDSASFVTGQAIAVDGGATA